MKYFFYFLFLINTFVLKAQVIKDTIFLNEKTVSVVKVPSKIIQINLDKGISLEAQPIELKNATILNLKAKKKYKDDKKITLLSEEGTYLVVLKYKQTFDPIFSLGTTKEESLVKTTESKEKESKTEQDKSPNANVNQKESGDYMRAAEIINSKLKRNLSRTKARYDKLKISLLDCFVAHGKLFLRIEFENKRAFAFFSDEIIFKITQNESFAKKSAPEEILTPIYIYKGKNISIQPRKRLVKTYVFDAFAVKEDRHFAITLLEKDTTHEIQLFVIPKIINQPVQF